MVEPFSDEQRRRGNRMLVVGFIGFVGLSSVLMAAYGGASLVELLALGVLGILTGVLLVVILGGR